MVSMVDPDRHRLLSQRRDQALRDLVELDAQVEAGEIPATRAAALRERYETEAAHALEHLAALERQRDAGTATPADTPGRTASSSTNDGAVTGHATTGRRRRLAGAVLAVVVAGGIVATVGGDLADRPDGGFVTGNVTADGGRDLSQVTNAEMEEVVAANPDIVPMRLRLAHRYLDAGDHDRAVDHYLAVLEREPNPEAMSHLGWLLFLDGRVDLAAELLERSRERAPEASETIWFLANVRLYGQRDPEAAVPLLERLLARDDLGQQRSEVEQALDDATDAAAGNRDGATEQDSRPGKEAGDDG